MNLLLEFHFFFALILLSSLTFLVTYTLKEGKITYEITKRDIIGSHVKEKIILLYNLIFKLTLKNMLDSLKSQH